VLLEGSSLTASTFNIVAGQFVQGSGAVSISGTTGISASGSWINNSTGAITVGNVSNLGTVTWQSYGGAGGTGWANTAITLNSYQTASQTTHSC